MSQCTKPPVRMGALCAACFALFKGRNGQQKTCSKDCAAAWSRERNREYWRLRYASDHCFRERHLEHKRKRYAFDISYRERQIENAREHYWRRRRASSDLLFALEFELLKLELADFAAQLRD